MRTARHVVALIVFRGVLSSIGAAALAWTLLVFPVFWEQALIEQTAKRVIAGEAFRTTAINTVAPAVDALSPAMWQRPSIFGSAAEIRLRALEQAVDDGNQALVDTRSFELRAAIRQALSQAPSDPFLWVVLFWLENSREGFSKDHIKYLRVSYATGPNEGWVAVRRNRLALALYSQLDPELATSARAEFVGLVGSRFVAQAATILIGAGWPIRGLLLPPLETIDLALRQDFAKAVYRLGYDIIVPGVEPRGQRPWD